MEQKSRRKIKNLTKCAIVGGAAAVLPGAAHAAIITVPVNVTVTNGGPTYDLTTNGGPDLTFSAITGAWDKNQVTTANGSQYVAGPHSDPADLVPGDVVGPSDTFSTGTGIINDSFAEGNFPKDGTPGYLGFEMPVGPNTDYGYVTLSAFASDFPPDSGANSITLYSFTYDDSGNPIGVAPEPTSLALFAAGALGLEVVRRRRKALAS